MWLWEKLCLFIQVAASPGEEEEEEEKGGGGLEIGFAVDDEEEEEEEIDDVEDEEEKVEGNKDWSRAKAFHNPDKLLPFCICLERIIKK